MRRALVVGVVLVVLSASAASAVEAPTAKQLARKAIAAGVCAGPVVAVDARGVTRGCTVSFPDGSDITVELHGYATKRAMLKGLDRERIAECEELADLGVRVESVAFTVGATWFTNSFIDSVGVPLRRALGGTVREYRCPT